MDTSEWPPGYPCWVKDGVIYIRASALGRCMVGAVGSLIGYAPTPDHPQLKRWFHEGKLHEPDIIQRLRVESGYEIIDPQDQVQVEVTPGIVFLIGHVDGHVSGEGLPVEAKSVGEWTWVNKVEKLGIERWVKGDMPYAYQFQTYLNGFGVDRGIYAVKDRNKGRFKWEVLESPLHPDAPLIRAREIIKWAEREQLPPCDGGCSDYSSPWWHIHERKPTKRPQVVKDELVKKLVTSYKDQLKHEKVLKEAKDDIKKELGPMLGEGKWQVDIGSGKPVSVTIGDKKVSRLSETKLREMFGDEAVDQCYEETTYPGAVEIR